MIQSRARISKEIFIIADFMTRGRKQNFFDFFQTHQLQWKHPFSYNICEWFSGLNQHFPLSSYLVHRCVILLLLCVFPSFVCSFSRSQVCVCFCFCRLLIYFIICYEQCKSFGCIGRISLLFSQIPPHHFINKRKP